jgi:mono/diheme cytochrome c family protein
MCVLFAVACEEGGPTTPAPSSTPGMEPPGTPEGMPHTPELGPVEHDGQFLRRLTRTELSRSLAQILGPVALPPTEPDLHQAGFARVGARHTTLSNSGVERISTAIEDVLDQVFSDEALRNQVLGCDVNTAGCPEDIVRRVGQAAWRRPVTQDELTRYMALYDACNTAPHQGARCVISGLLQSPYFQYRVELPSEDRVFRGYAMASRLSFLLWSLPPDLTLLQAAHRGELDTADGVRAMATQMLADDRARAGLRAFTDEWFRTDRLERLERDVLAQTNEELQFELGRSGTLQPWLAWIAFAAEEELRSLVEHQVFDVDGDYLDLLTTDVTFVDSNLVDIYGGNSRIAVEGQPNALGFARARHASDSPRRGVLGTMAILGQLGKQNETSPTRRGLYVMRKVLCQEVGEPPDNIDMCNRPEGVSRRNSMENHHMCAQSCAGCHAQMDPIGFAMDRFSTIGVFRQYDDWGFPIDSQVTWRAGNGDEMRFDSLRTLADQFKARPEATECVTKQVFRFATGREESLEDKAQIEALTEAFRGDGRKLKAFLIHFVGTDAFRKAPAEKSGDESVSLAQVSNEIFERHCGICHISTALGGLDLTNDDGLLDRLKAASSAGMPLVTPGTVEQSYLWHKVVGTHAENGGSGEQMPPSTPLSESERNLLRSWIENRIWIEEGAR